jgi:hypothetical protein
MCVGSSPVTSEITSASTRAFVAAASCPPWIDERCLRTVFMSWIGAPLARRARVTALRSAIDTPATGIARSAEPPPETSASSRSSGPSVRAAARISRAAPWPASSGTGCPASTTRMRRVGMPCP